jgi:hypothetical protein
MIVGRSAPESLGSKSGVEASYLQTHTVSYCQDSTGSYECGKCKGY